MKRYLIILTLYLCAVVPTMAQYYSVNYDKRTVAEMTAAFATEAATEAYYAQQVAKIREHYQAAEVAAAGIFTSKFLDRKALTNLGLWTSATENYYYRRIYNMVSAKIMPKIWTVAGMMLKSPQNALYWGSYQSNIVYIWVDILKSFYQVFFVNSWYFGIMTQIRICMNFTKNTTNATVLT